MYYKKLSFDPPEKESSDTVLKETVFDTIPVTQAESIEISCGRASKKMHITKGMFYAVLGFFAISLFFSLMNKIPTDSDSPLCVFASYLLEGSISDSNRNADVIKSTQALPSHAEESTAKQIGISDVSQEIYTESDKAGYDKASSPVKETADLSASNLAKISNETKYRIDINELVEKKREMASAAIASEESEPVFGGYSPKVLIIHTHGTECYSDIPTEGYRSDNTDLNVVSIGKHLFDTLSKNGISAIHCSEMFDKDSYINSYRNSFAAVNEYLKKYPSIKYVIDLHRDAVQDENGKYTKLLSSDGVAQLMFVVGTNEAGANHPNWKDNLVMAYELQQMLCEQKDDLMRPIYLRRASSNQQLCNGYFILEAGPCANTINEVLPSVEVFGEILARKLKGE